MTLRRFFRWRFRMPVMTMSSAWLTANTDVERWRAHR